MNPTTRFLRPTHERGGVCQVLVKVPSLWESTLKSQNCVPLLGYPGLPLGFPKMAVGRNLKERRDKGKKLMEKARICRLLDPVCARLNLQEVVKSVAVENEASHIPLPHS